MKHADFVHLHNHSDYSLLDGASPIPGMVARAAELRMPALALTDHGALFGAIEFYLEARKAGVKPIVGMEAYVSRTHRTDRSKPSAHHLVLLARDEAGFRNLCRLSSLAFLEGFYYKPRVDHEVLARHAEGLLALSACPQGEIATDLVEDRDDDAFRTAMFYRDLFGAENFFLEIQNHGIDVEEKIRAKVEALAGRSGIPIVATNDCHYLNPEDTDAQDILLCIQTGKNVSDAQRMRATANLHFRRPEEMAAAFAAFPEALRNTLAVAERCNLQLSFGKPLLPAFPLPDGERSADEYLRRLAAEALPRRYPGASSEVRERLDYELDVICRMGFASYFLIVRDFIQFARDHGIGVGPGRGSVAGSLVAYVLRITDIDPIEHRLIFERFLNPDRVTMPDIDIDFDDLRRGEVIEYVKRKYGEDNVTQIITFGTMGAKGVVRDVGRALGLAFADVDRIARLVPEGLGMTLERALELSPELKNLPQRGPEFERLLKTARTLEGLARHASTHAAGVLITPGPLLDHVPLYRQKDESVTTQWDMKSVEKAGLLKMDFLGLRTLSVLEEAVRLVEARTGERLDPARLPVDDPAAYQVFQEAATVAIFQFESTGMRDYLRRLKPTVFEDLIAMNALYRPGPMENIPYFIDCKHGRQVVRYEHPALEPILRRTYGVFAYQEQVMEAARQLAGFTLAQADELRRAMGKKLAVEMEAKRKAFLDGCAKNRIPAGKAEKIFQTMEKFAGYGFNACVTGDTLLVDAATGLRTTVERLYNERSAFEVHALDERWKFQPRRVVDVIANGPKRVFEVRTALGRKIVATANHPFRTLDGWTNLESLCVGDRIAAARELRSQDSDVSSSATRTPHAESESTRTAVMQEVRAMGDAERAVASWTEESDVYWDRIVAIEPRGVQETYDLAVEHDHNFVANGLVVHNSHSAAYALIAYQCAWFKAHHPAEFMAATLTSEMSNSERIVTLIDEVRRLGIEILPPDVNRSEWKFTLEEGAVRFGLGAVRNVGQAAVESVVAARAEGGPFQDLLDLARRVESRAMNRRVLESLIASGACDLLGPDRATLFAAAGRVLDQAAALHRERESGQSSLFGEPGGESSIPIVSPALPATPPWTARERSAREKEVLGFYFSEHPLEPLREALERIRTHAVADALGLEDATDARLAGLLAEVRPLTTKSGRRMAAVILEDQSGRIECTVFPDTFDQVREVLVADAIVVVSGRIEVRDDRGTKLLISEVKPLAEAGEAYRQSLHLEIRAEELTESWLREVDEVLSSFPGESEVYLHIARPDRSRLAMRSKRFRVMDDDEVILALRHRFPAVRARWGKAAT